MLAGEVRYVGERPCALKLLPSRAVAVPGLSAPRRPRLRYQLATAKGTRDGDTGSVLQWPGSQPRNAQTGLSRDFPALDHAQPWLHAMLAPARQSTRPTRDRHHSAHPGTGS